jgi:cobalt-zinc-cadmium efflux system outer membrane protein
LGAQTSWGIDKRLPDIPTPPPSFEGLEEQALRQSIDLASARQRLIIAGEQVGLSRATMLLPESSLGPGAEMEEGAWKVGPVFNIPLPLFDQGQGRMGRAVVELRRIEQEYYALGMQLRSMARAVRDRLQGAQDRALYYRDILLPLRERIVNEVQLQYNAMQLGVNERLRAREQQMQAAVAYVEALLEYWVARTEIEQILSGRLPNANGSALSRRARPRNGGDLAGH